MNSPRLPNAVELTVMLKAWSSGDASALERLTPMVYAELRRLARCNLAAERDGHLLQPSALVNEAFLRFMGGAPVEWSNRTHFFAFASRLMRQILIDFARAQDTAKRGHRSPHVNLSHIKWHRSENTDVVDLIDLDSALDELARLDARQARVVELRYFGGLENPEIAAVLGVSEPTVIRDWRVARAWLHDRLHSVQSQDERRPALGPQPGK
jgi:RNA polymerase sigma-70 factor (ECF subfamily)